MRVAARSERAALAAVAVVVAGLSIAPVGFLVSRTLTVDGSPSLGHVRRAYRTVGLGTMVGNSVLFAVGTTIIAVALGSVLAFVLVRTDFPFRGVAFVGVLLPLVVPNLLTRIAWIFLAGPRSGVLNQLVEPVLGPGTFDIFSLAGMVFVEGVSLTPLVVLFMAAAFRSSDPALEESALVSGVGLTAIVRRVTLPVVRPALLASALLVTVRALQTFETPAVLGLPGGVWVFSSRIWRTLGRYPPDLGQAGAYALSLLVLTGVGVLVYSRLTSQGGNYQVVTGRGATPRPLPLGRWRWPAATVVYGYLALAVVLPLVILVYVSTQPFYAPPSFEGVGRMSLAAYRSTLADGEVWRSARSSIVLAIGVATVVMLLTAVTSWLVVRSRVGARWVLDGMAMLPLALPGLVIGLALLIAFVGSPLPVYGTLWILFLAHFIRSVPFGVRYASAGMFQIAGELEEAAVVGGATWARTFRRVLLPLLRPSLVAGWLYVVIISLRELSASLLLYTPGNEVLSVQLWQRYQDGAFPEVAALGVLLTVVLSGLAAAAYRLGIVGDVARR